MGMTGDSSPLLAPVWEGGTIWRETFAMIEEKIPLKISNVGLEDGLLMEFGCVYR